MRLYDRLFTVELPDAEGDFLKVASNPASLTVAEGARVEPALKNAVAGERYQFLREAYFFVDPIESSPGAPVFNRIIALKDTWTTKAASVSAPAPTQGVHAVVADVTETRRPKKSRGELRAEQRAANPELVERFDRYQREAKLSKDDADVLTGDLTLAALLPTRRARRTRTPTHVARWLLNDLLGLAKDADLGDAALSTARRSGDSWRWSTVVA